MQRRHLMSVSAVTGVAVILSLTAVRVAGQTSSAPAGNTARNAAKSRLAPRTAWGKPDLQGVWDFRTVTPLERPEDLAGIWTDELDRCQVDHAALIASAPGDESSVAAAVRLNPRRYVGYFMFNPVAPAAVPGLRHQGGIVGEPPHHGEPRS